MFKVGFDNEAYLKTQSEKIAERIAKFGGKLRIPITAGEITSMLVKACILNLLVSLVLVFGEMFIDTINPKLQWENPTAAFKQNVNAVVSSFISMGVVGIFIVLMLFLPKTNLGMLIIGLIFAVIAAPLGYFYFKYAVKRIPKM